MIRRIRFLLTLPIWSLNSPDICGMMLWQITLSHTYQRISLVGCDRKSLYSVQTEVYFDFDFILIFLMDPPIFWGETDASWTVHLGETLEHCVPHFHSPDDGGSLYFFYFFFSVETWHDKYIAFYSHLITKCLIIWISVASFELLPWLLSELKRLRLGSGQVFIYHLSAKMSLSRKLSYEFTPYLKIVVTFKSRRGNLWIYFYVFRLLLFFSVQLYVFFSPYPSNAPAVGSDKMIQMCQHLLQLKYTTLKNLDL